MSGELTHFDDSGHSRMVDTTEKAVTQRQARASAQVVMKPETLSLIVDQKMAKGDVFEVARLAGIMGAKRTSDLIPLCHPLNLRGVTVEFEILNDTTIGIQAEAKITAQTGVEMEALVAASTAALTVYDMCKAVDRGMTITNIQLEEKHGGVRGSYQRD